jgi:EAL domain-containing protein (putative c-di-GMP-specific phosphodiesterase class I)
MSTMTAALNLTPLDRLASTYAQRVIVALPLMWAQRISFHNANGDICWQSGGVWTPSDREAVRLALERFVGQTAPMRADLAISTQQTAVLLRSSDQSNAFRGFIMLVVDNHRLRGKGQSINDLPVPVQRAAHDWGTRLAAVPTILPTPEVEGPPILASQVDRLLSFGPAVGEPQVDELFARLRAFPLALVTQALTPLQSGTRIRRYEIYLREASDVTSGEAPITLMREAEEQRLGSVLDRRVSGALIVWLSERHQIFADEPAQFSVNISASSLRDPNFLRFIELCVAKATLWPALIAFEVNQKCWREDPEAVRRLSSGLDILGAGLVIDDASLHDGTAELFSLPAMRLVKIDRSLTSDLAGSKAAQIRVAGIAQMARVAGIHSVAKQVERVEEQELLRALGVDFVQGHGTELATPLASLDLQREQRLIVDPAADPALAHFYIKESP